MVDHTEQFFRRITNAELDGKITVPNGGYRPSVSRPSQGVTLIAVTRVRDATAAEVAVIADPVLSQGGQRNTSARERCRVVLTERFSDVTKQRRR